MALKTGENKVQFGLDKLAYAVITIGTDGTESWAVPVTIPGAVSISMDPEGDETVFYADNIRYYVSNNNSGYSGSIEVAKVPEQMQEDVYGITKNTDGVLIENEADEVKEVALLGRFSGDKNKNLFVLYRCTLGRPQASHNTTEASKDPQTSTIDFTAIPTSAGKVKATTTSETTESVKEGWYTAVYTG